MAQSDDSSIGLLVSFRRFTRNVQVIRFRHRSGENR